MVFIFSKCISELSLAFLLEPPLNFLCTLPSPSLMRQRTLPSADPPTLCRAWLCLWREACPLSLWAPEQHASLSDLVPPRAGCTVPPLTLGR